MKGKRTEVLNSKKIKEISAILLAQWGYSKRIEVGILQRENDLFLSCKDLGLIELEKINVNSLGMYFAEFRNGTIRLSIEGSQYIGMDAVKNVIEIGDESANQWIRGADLDASHEFDDNFVIVKNNEDYIGCGRVKDGVLMNYVPKSRRISPGK